MKKGEVKFLNEIGKFLMKNESKILTGSGLGMLGGAIVFGVIGTRKAIIALKKELNYDISDETSKKPETKQIIKTTWKCFIPTITLALCGTGCIIGSGIKSKRKYTALETAYILSEKASKVYREKVIETIGERKEKEIKDEVAQDKVTASHVNTSTLVIPSGKVPIFDSISGRVFVSDIDSIKRAVNDLNREMRDKMWISLNELYYELGLDSIKIGDDLGWNIDRGYIDIIFSSCLDSNGTPCVLMDYEVAPIYDV